jgi:hypothetical protein
MRVIFLLQQPEKSLLLKDCDKGCDNALLGPACGECSHTSSTTYSTGKIIQSCLLKALTSRFSTMVSCLVIGHTMFLLSMKKQ